ncbi:MAG: DUF4124 domain-containing protein [Arenimonas sp.]|uniref:DUF4124 domain-containing protein n=1 Tax=Arenimonas sp. TaxID=1872635 RepID=UPI0025C2FAE4|nr:DUF4124 domain-containing protein [Arenimonas sp.]MBW8367665.1 DUF4124 domain-containing protein [Arenimonas sp.]
MVRTLPWFALALCCLLAWATPASAQGIRRCVAADGTSVFTDRACSEMDSVPMQAPPSAEGNLGSGLRGGFAQAGCARSPGQLLDRVRTALEARDVNRLASHYHWTGTGSGSGRRLMDELEAIAGQALVSVELVYPQPPPEPLPRAEITLAPGEPVPDFALPAAGPADAPQPRHLRVLQMRSDRAEQASGTVFQLRRNAGCWWIEL